MSILVVEKSSKFDITTAQSTLFGFSKLPPHERDIIEFVSDEYDLDQIGIFLLYFLRIAENGPRGHEYNISEPFFKQSSFREQCRATARFISQHYHGESQLYQFFYRWVNFQKSYDPSYKQDFLKMFREARNLKSRVFKQW